MYESKSEGRSRKSSNQSLDEMMVDSSENEEDLENYFPT